MNTEIYELVVVPKNIENHYNLILLLNETFPSNFISDENMEIDEKLEKIELGDIEMSQKDIAKKMQKIAEKLNKNIEYYLVDLNDKE